MAIVLRQSRPTHQRLMERSGRSRTIPKGDWIDPYPGIPGTIPEKKVYAELARHGIAFDFQEYVHISQPLLGMDKWYRADFSMPQWKIIIEVQGSYWHSQPKTIEKDALKFALYEMQGWRVLSWWDYDIDRDLQGLMQAVPEFRPFYGNRPNKHRAKWIDDRKGIQAMNRKRFKQWKHKAVTLKQKGRKAKANERTTVLSVGKF